LVLPFWYRLTRVVPDKGPLNGCSTSKGSEGRERGEKGKGRGGNEKGKGRKRRQAPPSPSPFPIHYATGLGEPFAVSGTLGDLTWLADFLTSK